MFSAPEATITAALIGAIAALVASRSLQKRDVASRRKQSISDTWNALVDVRSSADDLWAEASPKNLEIFIQKARIADSAVQRASIILEEEVVRRLRRAIESVTTYHRGKASLLDYRRSVRLSLFEREQERICSEVMEDNGRALDDFKRQLERLESDFRERFRKGA